MRSQGVGKGTLPSCQFTARPIVTPLGVDVRSFQSEVPKTSRDIVEGGPFPHQTGACSAPKGVMDLYRKGFAGVQSRCKRSTAAGELLPIASPPFFTMSSGAEGFSEHAPSLFATFAVLDERVPRFQAHFIPANAALMRRRLCAHSRTRARIRGSAAPQATGELQRHWGETAYPTPQCCPSCALRDHPLRQLRAAGSPFFPPAPPGWAPRFTMDSPASLSGPQF